MVKREKFISTFKIYLETWRFFHKNFDKSCLNVGKVKMSECQKMYVWRPGNRENSFFITWTFYQLTDLHSNYAIQLRQMSDIFEVSKNSPLKYGYPFSFAKNLKGRHFVVSGSKNLKLSTKHFFWCKLSKKCIFEFSAIFVSLLSRWPKR